MSKGKHPLHKEIAWIRKNGKHAEICNNCPDGYLVITLYDARTGSGIGFLQSQMDECIEYIKSKSPQLKLDI
jgi:hypothetical protein